MRKEPTTLLTDSYGFAINSKYHPYYDFTYTGGIISPQSHHKLSLEDLLSLLREPPKPESKPPETLQKQEIPPKQDFVETPLKKGLPQKRVVFEPPETSPTLFKKQTPTKKQKREETSQQSGLSTLHSQKILTFQSEVKNQATKNTL
jgi:hypothetical protein